MNKNNHTGWWFLYMAFLCFIIALITEYFTMEYASLMFYMISIMFGCATLLTIMISCVLGGKEKNDK